MSPEYGIRIESTSSSAVPLSLTAHDVSPGPVAFAVPLQPMLAGPVKLPSAVPVTVKSPAHFALKDPFALVAVCSLTFQTKFEQELGAGMMFADVQLPISAPLPAALGPVNELSRSKPIQPALTRVVADSTAARILFFMFYFSAGHRADFARTNSTEEEEVYQPQIIDFAGDYG